MKTKPRRLITSANFQRSSAGLGLFPVTAIFAFLSTGFFAGSQHCRGEDSTPDYGEAAERLVELGLPDSRGARYATLSPSGAGPMGGMGRDLFAAFPELYDLQMGGNAWILSEDEPSGTFRALVRFHESKEFSSAGGGASEGGAAFVWNEADLDADVEALLGFVASENPDSSFRYRVRGATGGRLLLAGAQLHRQGYVDEANRLIHGVLRATENPEEVVSEAISLLASVEYDAAAAAFFDSGDWEEFIGRAEFVAAKYGRGWKGVERAREMIVSLRDRESSPPTPTPPRGISLSEEDLALAARLGELSRAEDLVAIVLLDWPWVISDPEALDERAEKAGLEWAPPLAAILRRGSASIPLLLSLLQDDWAFPMDAALLSPERLRIEQMRLAAPGGGGDRGEIDRAIAMAGAYGGMGSPDEDIARPLTRGDLAAALLRPLFGAMPGTDAETLQVEAALWWSRHGDKDRKGIARSYLEDVPPEHEAFGAALRILVEEGLDAGEIAVVEDRFLQMELSLWGELPSSLLAYLEIRGPEAGEFGAKLLKNIDLAVERAIREYGEENEDMVAHMERQGGMMKGQLEAFVSVDTAEELLAGVLAGEKEIEAVRPSLRRRFVIEGTASVTGNVLEAAVTTDDPSLRQNLVALLDPRDGEEEVPISPGEGPDAHPQWIVLLDDGRIPGDDEEERGRGGGQAVNVSAAWTLERHYAPESRDALTQFWHRFGKRAGTRLLERARARAAGLGDGELPPLPREVPEERLEELEASLRERDGDVAAARTFLETLTLDDIESILNLLEAEETAGRDLLGGEGEAASEEPTSRAALFASSLLGVQFAVETFNLPPGWEKEEEILKAEFGSGRELVEALVDPLLERIAAGESFRLVLSREAGFGGLGLSLESTDAKEILEDEMASRSYMQVAGMAGDRGTLMTGISRGANEPAWFQGFWLAEAEASAVGDAADGAGLSAGFEEDVALPRSQIGFFNQLSQWWHPARGIGNDFALVIAGLPAGADEADEDGGSDGGD